MAVAALDIVEQWLVALPAWHYEHATIREFVVLLHEPSPAQCGGMQGVCMVKHAIYRVAVAEADIPAGVDYNQYKQRLGIPNAFVDNGKPGVTKGHTVVDIDDHTTITITFRYSTYEGVETYARVVVEEDNDAADAYYRGFEMDRHMDSDEMDRRMDSDEEAWLYGQPEIDLD